jgi:thiol-disulfide isomerase/thioredoxin
MKSIKHVFVILVFMMGVLFFYQAWAHDKSDPGQLLPKMYAAPEFRGLKNWINSTEIRSMRELKGKVVLIDFWTFGCINCIHTLPHVQKWHETYKDHGLVVLGIHAPEFSYEKKLENVIAAVKKYGLTFPVAIDNKFQLWRAYKNRYWPAMYLIDKDGIVRYMHFGEGRYRDTEAAIVHLLNKKYPTG